MNEPVQNDPIRNVLRPYLNRVQVRRGNGLTRNQNQTIRSYPRIPEVIERATLWLVHLEQTLGGPVYVPTRHAYWELVNAFDDWGRDVPRFKRPHLVHVVEHLPEVQVDEATAMDPADSMLFSGSLEFHRVADLTLNEWAAAMTIARQIGLLTGHGKISLSPTFRSAVQQT